MINDEDLAWEGRLHFGVVDAKNVVDLEAFLKDVVDGKVKFKREYKFHNKTTNYTRQYMAQILTGAVVMPLVLPSQMELGTGSGTPSATDTDLFVPVVGTLKPLSNTQVYLTYYAQYVCAWQTTDPITGTWTEIGLKDANNNLWAHASTGITVNTGEMLVGQWQVQILGN